MMPDMQLGRERLSSSPFDRTIEVRSASNGACTVASGEGVH
jgi:hypothetical protein